MPLYGRHGTIRAQPGQRDALLAILTEESSAQSMPGCRLYLVGTVIGDPDAISVTEVWDDVASHRASLTATEFVPVSGATILSSQRRGQRSF